MISIIINIVCFVQTFSRVRKINMIDLGDVLTGGQDVQHHGHDDENGGRVGFKGYDNVGQRPEA